MRNYKRSLPWPTFFSLSCFIHEAALGTQITGRFTLFNLIAASLTGFAKDSSVRVIGKGAIWTLYASVIKDPCAIAVATRGAGCAVVTRWSNTDATALEACLVAGVVGIYSCRIAS